VELPADARVLDIGCGDGSIAAAIMDLRSDVAITGVDVLVREVARIPVLPYDGVTLPFADASFDAVCLVDVLHHTDDPFAVLREAARVAPLVVVKDHLTHGVFALSTLRAMDWVGNARHGVRLPYNYVSEEEWRHGIELLGLHIRTWRTDLNIYPPGISWWFDRKLHVIYSASLP
jgi:SAM-dependent methyltransferase